MVQNAPGLRQSQSKEGSGLRWSSLALYLLGAAITARSLDEYAQGPALPLAVGLLALFLALFTALPQLGELARGRTWLLHGCFLLGALDVAGLTLVPPTPDYPSGLMVLLSFRAAHAFAGRTLWVWLGLMSALVAVPLMLVYGAIWGLALGLSPIVGCIALPAYALVNKQIEAARARSEVLVAELRQAHSRLQTYSAQAAELAAFEEHNRLARELHDSVSQTLFSINLTASAARLLLARDPARARVELERLRTLTQSALADMRGFIAQLRPAGR